MRGLRRQVGTEETREIRNLYRGERYLKALETLESSGIADSKKDSLLYYMEKAMILNNLGMIAMRKGETKIAKGLFAAAVETHPQHYDAAATRLNALEAVIEN